MKIIRDQIIKISFIFLFIVWNNIFIYSHENQILKIKVLLNNETLKLDQYYKINKSDSIKFETLKFYISNVKLFRDKNIVWSEENSYHLIDYSIDSSLIVNLSLSNKINYDKIVFNLGIDSNTNSSGAFGGDLDPTKGMYWTWQSGYINCKIEGKSNRCKSINNEFQFHLGGYQYPNSLQTIELIVKNQNRLEVNLDLNKFIENIDLKNVNHIMSPSIESVRLSEVLSKCFHIIY